jgi:protein-S-isoprenylcysteine O-methyltransferase Ste14
VLIKYVLLSGDVVFSLALLFVALGVEPQERIWFAGLVIASILPLLRIPWGDVAFSLAVLVVALGVAPHTRMWFAGIVVATIAFPLWIVARLQLGAAFSLGPEARKLVTSGLYSRLRHPVYLFGNAADLAALFTLQIWLLFWLGVALIPITWLRMQREERVLAATFGERYARYRQQTWF